MTWTEQIVANLGCGRNPLLRLMKWGHDGLHEATVPVGRKNNSPQQTELHSYDPSPHHVGEKDHLFLYSKAVLFVHELDNLRDG